ncbi:MAG: homoserine O-succinyltransferase [Lachnospiraceae bacterium]|nr:homoserine O-succinyltransferase [Lachnospiraceae bacterium]
MPIRINNDLPAKKILEDENIFVMDMNRAMTQDIRPLKIIIMNLMPIKQDTELDLLRSLSNTPLQVDVTFLRTRTHESKNTSVTHLDTFYTYFDEIKDHKFDGMIITGAPVELNDFEDVDYWEELVDIMEWSKTNVTSTLHICWAAQAGLYYHHGIHKKILPKKVSGVYEHRTLHKKTPLVRGFDDCFMAPHSRNTEADRWEIRNHPDLTILADSDEVGPFLIMAEEGRKIYVVGHPEYDVMTLNKEYVRDVGRGLNPEIPENYYENNNPKNKPVKSWRCHGNTLYTNWLNYYVYQLTPYEWD